MSVQRLSNGPLVARDLSDRNPWLQPDRKSGSSLSPLRRGPQRSQALSAPPAAKYAASPSPRGRNVETPISGCQQWYRALDRVGVDEKHLEGNAQDGPVGEKLVPRTPAPSCRSGSRVLVACSPESSSCDSPIWLTTWLTCRRRLRSEHQMRPRSAPGAVAQEQSTRPPFPLSEVWSG